MLTLKQIRSLDPEFEKYSDAELYNAFSQAGFQVEDFRDAPGLKSSADAMIGRSIYGLGRVLEDSNLTGAGSYLKRKGREIVEANPETVNSFSEFLESPVQGTKEAIGAAAGSMLPQLLMQGAGYALRTIPHPLAQVTGWGLQGLGAASIFAPEYGGIRDEQEQTGQNNISAAVAGAAANTAIEYAAGPQALLRKAMGKGAAKTGLREMISEFADSPLKTAGRIAGKTMIGEASEEWPQNIVSRVAGLNPDPLSPEYIPEDAFAAFKAGIGAMPFGAAGGYRGYRQHSGLSNALAPYSQQLPETQVDLLQALEVKEKYDIGAPFMEEAAYINQLRDDPELALEEAGGVIGERDYLDTINQVVGVHDFSSKQHKQQQREYNKLFNSGSGVFAIDPDTQQERELSLYEWLEVQNNLLPPVVKTEQFNPETGQPIPMPTNPGEAVGVIEAARVAQKNGQAIEVGSDLHKAILQANETLNEHGLRYDPLAYSDTTEETTTKKSLSRREQDTRQMLQDIEANARGKDQDDTNKTIELAKQFFKHKKWGLLERLHGEVMAAVNESPYILPPSPEERLQNQVASAEQTPPVEAQAPIPEPGSQEFEQMLIGVIRNNLTQRQNEYVAPIAEGAPDSEIADKFGVTPQAVNEVEKRIVGRILKHVAKQLNINEQQAVDAVRNHLKALRNRRTKSSDYDNLGLSPEIQAVLTQLSEIISNTDTGYNSGMAFVNSAGQTTEAPYGSVTGNSENKPGTKILAEHGALGPRGFVNVESDENEEVNNNLLTDAQKARAELYDSIEALENAAGNDAAKYRLAISDYQDFKPDGYPDFDTLPYDDRADYFDWWLRHEEDFLLLNNKELAEFFGGYFENTDLQTIFESSSQAQGSTEQTGVTASNRVSQTVSEVENADSARFSKTDATGGTTKDRIYSALSDWFFSKNKLKRHVKIVQSWDDLPAYVRNDPRLQKSTVDPAYTQGIYLDGKVYLIADNIPPGEERSVFMHEAGVHLGLTDEEESLLAAKVREWANAKEGSLERRIHDRAMRRMESAKEKSDGELVAYATEEAVSAGVKPTLVTMVGRWLKRLSDFIMAKLRAEFETTKSLTPLDLVDYTYGAAHIALELKSSRKNAAKPHYNQEYAEIEARYRGADQWLKAPNGKPSNLNERQWVQVRTPSFKAWFGDWENDPENASKIVDENGEPLVVYHGTRADITKFDQNNATEKDAGWYGRGIYFTADPDTASAYAQHNELKSSDMVLAPNVISAFVSLKNPYVWPKTRQAALSTDESLAIRQELETKGYDGVIVSNEYADPKYASHYEVIAFAPTQIKSAIGNTGEFNPQNPDIRFSKALRSPATSVTNSATSFMGTLADTFANAKGFIKESGLGWLTLEQLADTVKSKTVSEYHSVMVKMQQISKDLVYRASLIDQDWAVLADKNPSANKRMMEVMREATRAETDPDKGEGTSELISKFNALPEEAKQLYRRVRDYYESTFELRKQIMLNAANQTQMAGRSTAEVNRLFAKIKGPYFPLMRLGRWYAVGMSNEVKALYDKLQDGTITSAEKARYDKLRKDPRHYKASGFNSRAEAKRAAKQMQAELGNGFFNVSEERIASELASMPDIAKVEAYLTANMPTETQAQIKSLMAHMVFDMLPEHHALKRQMKREGIHGEEEDMRRVFAQSALSQAHYISRLKYANDLSATLMAVKKEGHGGNETMRMVANELIKRAKLAMDIDDHPMVDRLLQGSYFAHLGMSPAFILTNMTQVPMITAPWLGARHGFGVATRALADAYRDVFRMMKSTYTKEGVLAELNWEDHLNAGEAKAFQTLLDRNLLDITIEHDLGSVADMQNTKVDKYIKLANSPVRITELANRAITGLAAYRLAKAKGMSEDAAIEHAAKAVSSTQLDYSSLNTPRHMQAVLGSKAIAKLMFQFRKYQQGMVYLVGKNFHDAFNGATKEERDLAKRTLLGLFTTTGMMAGALGMPAFGSALWLASVIGSAFGDDDEPFDAEVAFRNWLTDLFGKDAALVLAKGLPTLINADLSRQVGLGDVLTPLPFLRQGKTGTDAINNTLVAAAGPAFSTIATTLDGVYELGKGHYAKAAEKIIPVKAAQNLIRAYRYETEGLTNRNGEIVIPDEKFSVWDLALRGAGFQPTKESEYYAANQAVEGRKQAVMDTRSRLLRDYAQAVMKGEATDDINEEIAEFNKRNPQQGVRIDYSSKHKAIQARKKMAAERDETGVRLDKLNRHYAYEGRFAIGQ